MNIDFETPMAALLAWWQAKCTIALTADATEASATLSNVSTFTGLFEGLPVTGPGVVEGATILTLDPGASEIVLSDLVGADVTDGAFQAGFQTVDRRVQHWDDCTAQPALFLRRIGATDDEDRDSGYIITTLECEAWIECKSGQNPDVVPDTGLTALNRLVRQSMAYDDPGGDNRFTIAGQVYWARIAGRSDASPGDQGPQALEKMPVRITLP